MQFSRTLLLRHAIGVSVLACLLAPGCRGPAQPSSAAEPAPAPTAADRVHVSPDSDPQAIEVAQRTVAAMGGWDAWDATRFLSWRFFGRRLHYWDRQTGDIRIEGPFREGEQNVSRIILMNVNTKQGRVWQDGEEITDPDALAQALEQGRQAWVNDSYWVIMPFKLLDPGVTLAYEGERDLPDGRAADVLGLTFAEGIGYTPQNRYDVFVARDTGLVEQWSYFADASDAQPRFTYPWTGWQRFGGVEIATVHLPPDPERPAADWEIAVHDSLPRSVFESPDPVAL